MLLPLLLVLQLSHFSNAQCDGACGKGTTCELTSTLPDEVFNCVGQCKSPCCTPFKEPNSNQEECLTELCPCLAEFDPYCCDTDYDAQCVNEAKDRCSLDCSVPAPACLLEEGAMCIPRAEATEGDQCCMHLEFTCVEGKCTRGDDTKCRSASPSHILEYDCWGGCHGDSFACANGYTVKILYDVNIEWEGDTCYRYTCLESATPTPPTPPTAAPTAGGDDTKCRSASANDDHEYDCWGGCHGDSYECANGYSAIVSGVSVEWEGETCYKYTCSDTASPGPECTAVQGAGPVNIPICTKN